MRSLRPILVNLCLPQYAGSSFDPPRPPQRFQRFQNARQAFFPRAFAFEAGFQCGQWHGGGGGRQNLGYGADLLG